MFLLNCFVFLGYPKDVLLAGSKYFQKRSLKGKHSITSPYHIARVDGKSGYSFSRLVTIVLDNIFGATVLPLRLVSLLGLSAAAVSVVLAIYYFAKYFSGSIGAPGFMTQVILTIFFGGSTLFSIGLIGEYLIRIIDEVRKPPRYVIRQVAKNNDAQSINADAV